MRQGEPLTYSGWQIPRSEGLFGLSTGATVGVICGAIISIICFATGGPLFGAIITAMWVCCGAPLLIRVDGRSLYEITVTRWQFMRLKKKGLTKYISGPLSKVPGGHYMLPGVLATTRLHEYTSPGGRRFGIIHNPQKNEYTIIFRVWPQGDEAVDQDVTNQNIFQWGSYLAYLGSEGDIVGATAVVETIPSTGQRVRQEVASITSPSSPRLAQQIMAEAADIQATGRLETHARLALTFTATTNERRRHWQDQAVVIGQRLPALASNLQSAGLVVREMTKDEIVQVAARSYSPARAEEIEQAAFTQEGHGLGWEDAGPGAAEQTPTLYKHDGAVSTTWEMREPPRGSVTDKVLRSLLAPNPDLPRKRVALCYRPHSAAEAAKIVDDDYSDALQAVRGSRKATPSAQAMIRLASTEQATKEEARGHGVSRFGILLTITETDEAKIPNADAVLKSLSQQARIKIRRRYGSQQISFAAGLGLGVLIPEHVSTAGMMQL